MLGRFGAAVQPAFGGIHRLVGCMHRRHIRGGSWRLARGLLAGDLGEQRDGTVREVAAGVIARVPV
jgi:hypothetical protein